MHVTLQQPPLPSPPSPPPLPSPAATDPPSAAWTALKEKKEQGRLKKKKSIWRCTDGVWLQLLHRSAKCINRIQSMCLCAVDTGVGLCTCAISVFQHPRMTFSFEFIGHSGISWSEMIIAAHSVACNVTGASCTLDAALISCGRAENTRGRGEGARPGLGIPKVAV